jgi:hypothetical protein
MPLEGFFMFTHLLPLPAGDVAYVGMLTKEKKV